MNANSTVRRKKRPVDHYTMVHNDLARDSLLSPKAKGVAIFLLSHDAGYKLSLPRIAKQMGVGETLIRAALQEMEKLGYLERTAVRDRAGRITGMDYVIDDHPEKPARGKTTDGLSVRGLPTYGEPTCGEPAPIKKTKKQEDQKERKNPPPPLAVQGKNGGGGISEEEKQVNAWVSTLPVGTRTPTKKQLETVIDCVTRLLTEGADLRRITKALTADMADAKHFFGIYAHRVRSYQASQFAPIKAAERPAGDFQPAAREELRQEVMDGLRKKLKPSRHKPTASHKLRSFRDAG
jgi:hypothetical protein